MKTNPLCHIVCPECGHINVEEMPADRHVALITCGFCGLVIRKKADDCCVFCSYGSVKCPEKQGQSFFRLDHQHDNARHSPYDNN